MMNYDTGATFYPGGDDSYYMPEIIQPAPHRAGEHPMDMAQNVASMEQVVQGHAPSSQGQGQERNLTDLTFPNGSQNGSQQYAGSQNMTSTLPTPAAATATAQYVNNSGGGGLIEQPNFSPFPILYNRTANIPPTDDEKEATLESARLAVLSCNDPDVQLTWARDALAYVETAQQNEQRILQAHPDRRPRPRTPRIEHALREDALKIVNFLADQHHPTAEFMRGLWLEFGKFGERIDKREAFYCYQRASERQYARADYRIGMQFESSNDALKAIKYYQRAADAGDSAANYRLGMMTLLGQHGQQQDFEKGLRMIAYSAETADENAPQGAYVYGMLQAGELPQIQVPEEFLPRSNGNLEAAAKINIEKAAYLGFAKAQLRMGSAYELGELGCAFDAALSLHYYHLAARQGEAEAEMAISKWFLCGQEGVFEKNEAEAFEYAQRAAAAGTADGAGGLENAQFAMGYFYEVGIHVKPDFARAKEWYTLASENGNADASARINAISRSKTLSRKDHEHVALRKIRGQHGSVHQHQEPVPSLPSIHEPNPIDMPDPSRISLSSPAPPLPLPLPSPTQTGPSRPYSAAPYPPSSTEFRPTSAFGINPNLRANRVSPTQGPTHNPNLYNPRPPLPPPKTNYTPPRPQSQQQPQPYQQQQQQQQQQQRQQQQQQQRIPAYGPTPSPAPAPVDIGFVAPLDPTGADRNNRPQDPWQNRPPLPHKGSGSGPVPQVGRRPAQGQGQVKPGPGRTPVPAPDKVPTPVPPKQSPPASSISPPPNTSSTSTSTSTNPTNANKLGPQTFEEMGIPRTKEKRDCIVM